MTSAQPLAPQLLGGSRPVSSGGVSELDRALASLDSLEDRLALVASQTQGRIAFSTSLGIEDQVVLHAVAAAGIDADIFMLDTGRHFLETLETLEASVRRYQVTIRVIAPDAGDLEALVARDGVLGFRASVDARKACCDVRKVVPLRRALAGAAVWITGLRREQAASRTETPFAAFDDAFGVLKVNPLADWSQARIEAAVVTGAIPVNALHTRGFPSIGCQPCTRAIRPGEDVRAGRWWWEQLDGKECGLHNRPYSPSVPATSAGRTSGA